ncbi:MAG TPA: hypothetical protein PK280_18685 [Planctomycetota bacterium]|nr:hypothetical protein [Planctomycetota bacterium]
MRHLPAVLAALLLGAAAARPAEPSPGPAVPAVQPPPNADFESARPWDGWELVPADPREAGRSEWERLTADFTAPASGRAAVELTLDGSGRAELDDLDLFEISARGPVPQRRMLTNPGFEEAGTKTTLAAAWDLSGPAVRTEAPSAPEGRAGLRMELPRTGRAAARQVLMLEPGRRYQLHVRVRAEVTSGALSLSVLEAGGDSTGALLTAARLRSSTLSGGSGLCGRLSAPRGAQRLARLDCPAVPGKNYTLELLARGETGDRPALRVEVAALDEAGTETLLAAAAPEAGALGPDWRPLRVGFALRGARRLRFTLRLEGPAAVEIDSLKLSGPRVVPGPRRLAPGDADDNFRPRSRRPLVTGGGRNDADTAAAFTAILSQSLSRPQSSWRFWRSSKPLEHQPSAFAAMVAKGFEPGTVFLLDPSGESEAKWLAERAVSVPDRPGAYSLAVSAKEVVVASRSPAGFVAAASTLGWLTTDSPEPEIFACRIEDWPAHPFRAAALEFDGRLSATDRELLGSLGSWRLSHLLVTGPGLWRLPEARGRNDLRELAEFARGAAPGGLVGFLDAVGAAPELLARSPQSAECLWVQGESHFLRGTERSYLSGRNVLLASGSPVEVAAPDGRILTEARDYRLETAAPRWGASGEEAPRSLLRRIPGADLADGGRVTVSYNVLPPAGSEPVACPRSEEALAAFRGALGELGRSARVSGVGLGGAFVPRMRTDRRTASTRFKNGRMLADRIAELCAEVDKGAAGASPLLWADLLNPCGGLTMPEDPPTAAADLLDPALRRRLLLLVNLPAADEDGRDRMTRSAAFLAERGYNLIGWTGERPAGAARTWLEALPPPPAPAGGPAVPGAPAAAPAAPPEAREVRRGEFIGLAFNLRGARTLDIETFAEAAWGGPETVKPAPAR